MLVSNLVNFHKPAFTGKQNVAPVHTSPKSSVNAQTQVYYNYPIAFYGKNYTKIDLAKWDRRQVYSMFNGCQNPFFSLTADRDITKLLEVAKKKNIPSSQAILYMIGKTVNEIDNFKYRKKDDGVVKYKNVDLSIVVGTKENLFNFCKVKYDKNPNKFLKMASESIEEAKNRDNMFYKEGLSDDVVYVSTLPWLHFTSMTNPIYDYKTDCIPRIVWGKYTERNGKTEMPVGIEMHHALADGFHASLFYNKLQENFDNSEKIFANVDKNKSLTSN